jgi:hypothetical protein
LLPDCINGPAAGVLFIRFGCRLRTQDEEKGRLHFLNRPKKTTVYNGKRRSVVNRDQKGGLGWIHKSIWFKSQGGGRALSRKKKTGACQEREEGQTAPEWGHTP